MTTSPIGSCAFNIYDLPDPNSFEEMSDVLHGIDESYLTPEKLEELMAELDQPSSVIQTPKSSPVSDCSYNTIIKQLIKFREAKDWNAIIQKGIPSLVFSQNQKHNICLSVLIAEAYFHLKMFQNCIVTLQGLENLVLNWDVGQINQSAKSIYYLIYAMGLQARDINGDSSRSEMFLDLAKQFNEKILQTKMYKDLSDIVLEIKQQQLQSEISNPTLQSSYILIPMPSKNDQAQELRPFITTTTTTTQQTPSTEERVQSVQKKNKREPNPQTPPKKRYVQNLANSTNISTIDSQPQNSSNSPVNTTIELQPVPSIQLTAQNSESILILHTPKTIRKANQANIDALIKQYRDYHNKDKSKACLKLAKEYFHNADEQMHVWFHRGFILAKKTKNPESYLELLTAEFQGNINIAITFLNKLREYPDLDDNDKALIFSKLAMIHFHLHQIYNQEILKLPNASHSFKDRAASVWVPKQ